MAFKFKTFAAVGALIGSLALVGCGQDEKDPNHIKVGVIVGAEQQVAEVAQKVAKDKYGLDVELVTFNDYVLPNEALSKGDISLDDAQIALAVINTTYASQIGLTPAKDGIFVEDKESPYVNLIVTREDNKDAENVKKFVQAYQSDEVYEAANKVFNGGAVKGW